MTEHAQIPYFLQALLEITNDLPINIKGMAIGDGSFGNDATLTDVVATSYFQQQKNDILNIPRDIIDVFKEADERCGFTKVLQQATYPPNGIINIPSDSEGENFKSRNKRQTAPNDGCVVTPSIPALINQSINACNIEPNQAGACATFTTGLNYLKYSRPWYARPSSFIHSIH